MLTAILIAVVLVGLAVPYVVQAHERTASHVRGDLCTDPNCGPCAQWASIEVLLHGR